MNVYIQIIYINMLNASERFMKKQSNSKTCYEKTVLLTTLQAVLYSYKW
jgi:hypothetical protein